MIDIAIIVWAVVFNALADRYYPSSIFSSWREWTPAQWRWHILKWLHFYPPLMRIVYLAGISLLDRVLLAVVCFLIWRFFYKVEIR